MATYNNYLLTTLDTQLRTRLGDTGASPVFWTAAELRERLWDAIRIFNSLTGYTRATASFNTVAGTATYDLSSVLSTQRPRTATCRTLIPSLQQLLMETGTSATWTGPQFSAALVNDAMTKRWAALRSRTAIKLTESSASLSPGPISTTSFNDLTTDIRRLVWRTAASRDYPLYRSDEHAATSYNRAWQQGTTAGLPYSYSVIGAAPLEIRFMPPILEAGTLRYITVESGGQLDFTSAATGLALPDDLTWVLLFGTLASMLSGDGDHSDPPRAEYAESMWQLGLQATESHPTVLHAEINSRALSPCALYDLDTSYPGWETRERGTPTSIAMAGPDLVALYPVPDDAHSVTLTLVRAIDTSATSIQLGDELADAILGMAAHLALFKCGGAEFAASVAMADRFQETARMLRSRLAGMAPNATWMMQAGTRESVVRPLYSAQSLGASNPDRQAERSRERYLRRKE